MSPSVRLDRILFGIDQLALAFLEDGRRAAAVKLLEVACTLRGECAYEADCVADQAEQMAQGEGRAV